MPHTDNWASHLPLKIVNVLAVLFWISSSTYSAFAPGHVKETYLTPGGGYQYAWSIVNLLLIGFSIYQFFDNSGDAIHGVGWRFALVAILNSIFIHVYVTRHFLVAFIFSLLALSVVSSVYYSLKRHYAARNVPDLLFVHLPWSLWHAWSITIVFESAFAAFTHGVHGGHPGVTVTVVAVLSIAFLALTSVGYAFGSKEGDLAGSVVLSWFLWSVYSHQTHHANVIHWAALVGGIVSLFAIAKSLYFGVFKRDGAITLGNDERAPLVA